MPPLLCLVATSPPAAPAHVSTTSAAAYTARAADVSDIGRARSAVIDTAIAALPTRGGAGGHDGAFFLCGDAWMPDSADRVRLEITGFTQVRGVARVLDDTASDRTTTGFDLRRSRLRLRGALGSDGPRIEIGGAFATRDGTLGFSDVFAEHAFAEGVTGRIGRFRPSFLREEVVSARRLQLADRSVLSQAFGQARRTGAALEFVRGGGRLTAMGAVAPGSPEERLASVRAEWLAAGDWRGVRDMNTDPAAATTVLLSAALLHHEAPPGGAGPLQARRRTLATVDCTVKQGDLSILLEAAAGDEARPAAGARPWAAMVQAGWRVRPEIELLGQVSGGDAADGSDRFFSVTAGITYFIDGHRLKWTTDITRVLAGSSRFWGSAGNGIDPMATEGQTVVRSQVQVAF